MATPIFVLVACWPTLNHAHLFERTAEIYFPVESAGSRVDSLLISPGGRAEREGVVGVTGRGSAPSALLIARRVTAAPNISAGDGGVGFLPSLEYPGTPRRVAPPATKDDANNGRQRQATIFVSGGDDTNAGREANES